MSRRSRSHFAINLAGSLIPIAISLATVPIYLAAIGTARYGIVSVAWILLGYFGFLDFGLSRASANALARVGQGTRDERAPILVTAFALNLATGLVGSALLYVCARLFVAHGIQAPAGIIAELRPVLPYLAAMLPLGMIAGVATGALESREMFVASNTISTVGTVAGQMLPLLAVSLAGPSLGVIIPALFFSRLLTILVSFALVFRVEGRLSPFDFDRAWIGRLLHYGAWVTVTSLISPLLESLDQFLIAAMLGASAVAEYAVPMNLAMRSQVVATALARTLFPQLSRLSAAEAVVVMEEATIGLAYGFAAIIAPAIMLAHGFLTLWVGARIAAISAPVADILLLGAWANGVAFIPYAFLQGKGRPDLTAKAHMVEVIPFIAVLVGLTHVFGLPGAALAWTLRVAADLAILLWMSGRPVLRIVPAAVLVATASAASLVFHNLLVVTVIAAVLGLVLVALGLALSSSLRQHLRAATSRLARTPAGSAAVPPLTPEIPTEAAACPRVSIAMATYNGARFLQAQLDSLAAQIRHPAELVVSDDNSSDETRAIVTAFAANAPFPVHLLPPGPRLGYADNFLRAAGACGSEYVAFCDQDDVWLPQKLDTCIARLTSEHSICATHRHILTDAALAPRGTLNHRVAADGVHAQLTLPLYSNPFGNSMVFRRDLLDAVGIAFRPPQPGRTELPLSHDTWVYNIAASLGPVSHIAEPLVLYRQHGNNVFGGDWTPPTGLRGLAARLHVPLTTYREQEAYHRMLAQGFAACALSANPYAAPAARAAEAHRRAALTLQARLALYETPVISGRWQARRELARLQTTPSSRLVRAKEALLGLCGLNPLMQRLIAPLAPSERI